MAPIRLMRLRNRVVNYSVPSGHHMILRSGRGRCGRRVARRNLAEVPLLQADLRDRPPFPPAAVVIANPPEGVDEIPVVTSSADPSASPTMELLEDIPDHNRLPELNAQEVEDFFAHLPPADYEAVPNVPPEVPIPEQVPGLDMEHVEGFLQQRGFRGPWFVVNEVLRFDEAVAILFALLYSEE